MIPSVLARQLQQGYRDYLSTTFPAANEPFRSSFQKIADTGEGLYLEPYTSLRLPYRGASEDARAPFEALQPAFSPWLHQQRAWERLAGDDARSTIVATGTGSGKTECFLYPLLDHCWRERGQEGIKALIIYPMNALATDQAGRIARLIDGNDRLRGNVTAGLFVGGFPAGGGDATMGADHVISNRAAMIDHPPDILLTNYKMLDLMLVRPGDAPIWDKNRPDTLRYVVVDELHTFDGAQGTDLACLLRRLKQRLAVRPGSLCCVGTSATLGGEGESAAIRSFAQDVFGEEFEEDSVIGEERLSAEDFLSGVEADLLDAPGPEDLEALDAAALANDEEAYLSRALAAFVPKLAGADPNGIQTRLALGEALPRSLFFQDLLRESRGKPFRASEMAQRLALRHGELRGCERAATAVDAILALVSLARRGAPDAPRPFMDVQTQLWARELARVLMDVDGQAPGLSLAVNLNAAQRERRLPVVNCRDCGHTAWVGISSPGQMLRDVSDDFYNEYFHGKESVLTLWPREPGEPAPEDEGVMPAWLCPSCLKFSLDEGDSACGDEQACPNCGNELLPVWLATLERSSRKDAAGSTRQYRCPHCGSAQGLSLVGMRNTIEAEVALTEFFASRFDDDQKTLVFSDNVQDASHRAAFFNGRTWKFGLRGAMAQYLEEGGEGLAFADFGPGLVEHWRGRMSEEDFVARFTPPNNTWMREYERLEQTGSLSHGKDTKALLQNISDRLRYEVLLEFGLRSQTGRTLEKSGVATLAFDEERLGRAALEFQELLANELGIEEVGEGLASGFLAAFLDTLRRHGAFSDAVFEEYLRKGAQPYLLSHSHLNFLPGQHASGLPSFLLVSPKPQEGFDSIASPAYARLAERLVDALGGLVGVNPSELVDAARRACEDAGLLARMAEGSKYECVGLDERALRVTGRVVRFVCDDCGTKVLRAADNADAWEGAPCLHPGCAGHLRRAADQDVDYYGALFQRGLTPRVQAHEHTGLIDREEREKVEEQFKAEGAERRSWYPNVLSCTPTLEMGIDVGDLSTVVLCGMPPRQDQYLQRTGRAGRRDGNSLVVVLADATPHGMYFYDEPEAMIEGEVQPPHVFLQASAVLERQFTAFCFDNWVREEGARRKGGERQLVPRHMAPCLNNVSRDEPDPERFPFNLLNYVKSHNSRLIRSFLGMFSTDFSSDSDVAQALRRFASGSDDPEHPESPLHVKFHDAFLQRAALRESYRKQKNEVGAIIDELQSKPKDSSLEEEIKKARAEQNALVDVIGDIDKEEVYGFLTRESLLPNYAFPEEGAQLRTILRRRVDDDEAASTGRRWKRTTREYSRGAPQALSEFAPGNTFYADGRHFKVDQVDLATATPETWRLCPNCSHAERVVEGKTPVKACPKCGSLGWGDADQERRMLRLSTVISNGDYEKTLSDDSSESRRRSYYSNQMLVEVDDAEARCATKIEGPGIDSGFEYVGRATLREINFGSGEGSTGHEVEIAGDKRPRAGFKVCRHCGAVALPDGKGELKAEHAYGCPVRRKEEPEEQAYDECLFLYREFQTEALRILVPETSLGAAGESILESFEAAVMLGLRKTFGNVDHLRTVTSEEPIAAGSGCRRRYLVVYDTVPGGTGYLKQLMSDEDGFMDVLRRALEALKSCSCNDDPDKDGCYRCLFAHSRSRDIGHISRDRAVRLLEKLLSEDNEVTRVPSIGRASVNNLLESELEERFVDALSGAELPGGGQARCGKEVVNGKQGYRFSAGEEGPVWEVEPQVELGPAQGVAVQCRPDFVLWPLQRAGEGSEALPVAVFTDGFEFHRDEVADDTLKREAIRRSGRFRVWTLSWADVAAGQEGRRGEHWSDLLDRGGLPGAKLYQEGLGAAGDAAGFAPSGMNAFQMLLYYLSRPDATRDFAAQAQLYSIGMLSLDVGQPRSADALARFDAAIDLVGPDAVAGCPLAGVWQPDLAPSLALSAAACEDDLRQYRATRLLVQIDDRDPSVDGFERDWNGFWTLWNFMQFFEGFEACAVTGSQDGVYAVLGGDAGEGTQAEAAAGAVPAALVDSGAWDEVLDYLVEAAQPFARRLARIGAPAPDPDDLGFQLEGDGPMAELAWPDLRCCYFTPDQLGNAPAFRAAGWRVLSEDAGDDELLTILRG